MTALLSMPPLAAYDPLYDPLVAPTPGRYSEYAPTYWIATAGTPPDDDGPIAGDREADVVVVGSGFTGLTCALFLAREHGIKATVLDANRVAWGCSTRNGGQAQNAAGRLTRSQWIARYGEEIALKLHAELREGFELFESLIRDIPCDPQPGGHLYVAHRRHRLDKLDLESEVANRVFGYKTRMLSREEVRSEWLDEAEAMGALHEPLGIGVQPAKVAFGYLKAAREAGATVHPGSPVVGVEQSGGAFLVRTPSGTVRARAVAVATGGYTGQTLPALGNRIMPILSNSIVTRPLSDAEIAETAFKTRQIITDTRTLRHYYRLLPDNRVQIGSRSAITGADADAPRHLAQLRHGLARKFPPLRNIDLDYSWWGWVDVSHDMMPRIVQPEPKKQLFYSVGYGGNGVSFSAQAGRRLAGLVAGRPALGLPIFQGQLPGHPFAPFRRLGQRMLYKLYEHRDEAPDRDRP